MGCVAPPQIPVWTTTYSPSMKIFPVGTVAVLIQTPRRKSGSRSKDLTSKLARAVASVCGMNLNSTVWRERAREMEKRWKRLCSSYLPVVRADSVWRYSRQRGPNEPEQGWKLHISSTVLNAAVSLKKIAPVLSQRGVQCQAPDALQE